MKICFHIVSYQPASRVKPRRRRELPVSFLFYICVPKPWMIYWCLITEAKKNPEETCFKVPWRPFHSCQQCTSWTMGLENSRIAVNLWNVCLWPSHAECYILFFLFRCQLVLLKSFVSAPPVCVSRCYWHWVLPAVFQGLLMNYFHVTLIYCKYVRMNTDTLSCLLWL